MHALAPQPRRAILPMAGMSAVAWISGLLDNGLSSPTMYVVSLAIFAVNVGVMLALANRQPGWLLRLSPYCYLSAAALLVLSQSDTHPGLSVIVLLPVLAVAARGSRVESAAIVIAMVLALLAIQLEIGASGVVLGRVLTLWGTLGAVVSLTIHGLRERLAAAHEELAALAMTDPLTRVANRRGLEVALARSVVLRSSYAVLCLDVDGLKLLNDTHGHQAGDELLIAVADACQQTARAGDVVARLGGDELVVFVADVDETQARAVADRLQHAIAEVRVGAWPAKVSIGIAAGHADSAWEDVLRTADSRMYENKRAGRTGQRLPAPRVTVH